MRRLSIVALLVCALAVSAGTTDRASAAEGDPGDYCSYSPDYPFGWSFNAACEVHDTCIDALDAGATLDERLACDDVFLDAMFAAPHLRVEGRCAESGLCAFLARIYHGVVRWVTLQTWPAPPA